MAGSERQGRYRRQGRQGHQGRQGRPERQGRRGRQELRTKNAIGFKVDWEKIGKMTNQVRIYTTLAARRLVYACLRKHYVPTDQRPTTSYRVVAQD